MTQVEAAPSEQKRAEAILVSEAAVILGIGTRTAYDAIERSGGNWLIEPVDGVHRGVPVIRVGKRMKVGVARLREVLGEEPAA